MGVITAEQFRPGAFEAYGEVAGFAGVPDIVTLDGALRCYADRVQPDYYGGAFSISLLEIAAQNLPLAVPMLERHPLGSQTFIPMSLVELLVVVADDMAGKPVNLRAFRVAPNHILNISPGIWHAPIAPLVATGRFAVLDRIGRDDNLEIHRFEQGYVVQG